MGSLRFFCHHVTRGLGQWHSEAPTHCLPGMTAGMLRATPRAQRSSPWCYRYTLAYRVHKAQTRQRIAPTIMSDSLPPASYPSYSLGSNPRRVPTSDGLLTYRVTRMSVWLRHLATTLYGLRVSVTRLLTSTRYTSPRKFDCDHNHGSSPNALM